MMAVVRMGDEKPGSLGWGRGGVVAGVPVPSVGVWMVLPLLVIGVSAVS